MHNRIGDSSNLLTASSQSEHGIRQNPFIYYKICRRMNYKNLTVLRYRVGASVYPTPHNKIWLSSGRVPLYSNLSNLNNLKLSINNFIPNLGGKDE